MTDEPSRRIDTRGRTLREHAARGTIINSAFFAGLGLIGLLRGFILAGLLDPDDYGVWGIIVVSLGTLGWLKQVGISDRYVQQEDADQTLAFQRAFTLEAIFNAIFGLVVLIAIPIMTVVYGESRIVAPALVLLLLLPAVTLQTPLWVFYRRMQFARQRSLQALDPLVGVVVAVGLAAAGAGYWAFVGGMLAGAWVTAIASWRASPYPLAFRYDRGTARKYVAFSGPLLISSIGGIVIAQGSILAGNAVAGVAGAGAITLASQISQFTNRVDEILSDTLYPAICAVVDRTEVLFETFVKSNRLALMWAIPFGFGMALFASDLVRFGIGERWEEAVEPLQAFGVAAAIAHLGFNWTSYFMARGDTRPIAVHSVVSAAAFLAIELPLIIAYGLRGLAIGTLALLVASLAVRWFYLRRLFTDFRLGRHALRALAPALPAVALVLIVRELWSGDRTTATALAEVALYLGASAVITGLAERALLREAFGYLARKRAQPA